jgi:hypothetical protein
MVLEMSVSYRHLTQLIAREDFMEFSRHESSGHKLLCQPTAHPLWPVCYIVDSIILWSVRRHGKSRDSSIGIALGYGLDYRGSGVRFLVGAGNFSLHHRVQNGSGAHPASCPMGTRGSFPGRKAAGVWNWPLTSI